MVCAFYQSRIGNSMLCASHQFQGDLFGASFSLDTAGVADLPKDILIPGEQSTDQPQRHLSLKR